MQNTNQEITIGWDIGGAHTKAAFFEKGVLKDVMQVACPLWRGLDELVLAVQTVIDAWSLSDQQVSHAITMTGELVDLFPNRKAGVISIAKVLEQQLSGARWYYRCDHSSSMFVEFAKLEASWESVASANWHASTSLIAQQVKTGLFVDIGSTTTDLSVMHEHRLHNEGYTDAGRMRSGELIYTGVVRTPLMALGPTVTWLEHVQPITAEYFATTADVYRMTEQLASEADMADSADDGDKSRLATAIRLARMVGHDVEDFAMLQWVALAEAFKVKQRALLVAGVKTQLKRLLSIEPELDSIEFVSAGVGGFLVKEVIAELTQNGHYPKMQLHQSATILSEMATHSDMRFNVALHEWASHCLPAVAVAILANQNPPTT